jgi:hypothetical protein
MMRGTEEGKALRLFTGDDWAGDRHDVEATLNRERHAVSGAESDDLSR